MAGFGSGAFIFSPIQTKFINPDNYTPDKDGYILFVHMLILPFVTLLYSFRYFYQADLLDRVPVVFLLLAGCFQAIGAFFLVDPPNAAERACCVLLTIGVFGGERGNPPSSRTKVC